jgi:hypothetical protein
MANQPLLTDLWMRAPLQGLAYGGVLGLGYGAFWGLFAPLGSIIGMIIGFVLGACMGTFMLVLSRTLLSPSSRPAAFMGIAVIGNTVIACMPAVVVSANWGSPLDSFWIRLVIVPTAIAIVASSVLTIRETKASLADASIDSTLRRSAL